MKPDWEKLTKCGPLSTMIDTGAPHFKDYQCFTLPVSKSFHRLVAMADASGNFVWVHKEFRKSA